MQGFAKYLYKRDTFKYHAFFVRICMADEIHIGRIIRRKLREKERTVTWFAQKLCCIRSNVYKIFGRQSVDTSLLLRISSILEEDLFVYYSEILHKEKGRVPLSRHTAEQMKQRRLKVEGDIANGRFIPHEEMKRKDMPL